MPTDGPLNPESEEFLQLRPAFWIGQHDSSRVDALTDGHYDQILNSGFGFATAPITNEHFHQRAKDLYRAHLSELQASGLSAKEKTNPSLPGPILPTLTDKDSSLGPCPYIGNVLAYSSPWIDLGSSDPIVASISRQALNLEVAFANWCGVRSVIVPGPRRDDDARAIAQFARAIQESFDVATRVNIIIHIPMYREPGLEERAALLSTELLGQEGEEEEEEVDLFGAWDTWHTIRSVCNYANRLYVALRIPRRLPEMELQTRWFAEPLHYLTLGPNTFQPNKTGNPSLSRHHQDLISTYMRLKTAPWFLLCDVGPSKTELDTAVLTAETLQSDFPSLADAAHSTALARSLPGLTPHIMYMNHLQRQQEPYTRLETETLTSFQDWLQSPLQPLSDNLESATYEMFEGDPVKYDLYEQAMYEAMSEWKVLGKPTSSATASNDLVVTVAGAGRGPLVTRALRASERSGVPIQLWAVEKNQNAYVYLLRQNATAWGGRVHVIKTDMRDWAGPVESGGTGKVDILVTELLGSFGDNELSPECLDGIQRHIARPHGLSIPESYTAWLSPIATPRIHAHLRTTVLPGDANAFETPWVVRLYQMDLVAQRVPGRPRFQQAWEFVHPVWGSLQEKWEAKEAPKPMPRTLGGGAMNNAGGLNEHNARHCHLTFYCRPRGVIHGLAGYFESTLYTPQTGGGGKELVELSILPDQIDKKSRDMVSWFPIFFPLKQPLYFPQDSELEISMWRQTDDTRVWYEWMVEAYTWVGAKTRVKVGASEMHSSKKVACLMQ
ncbi:Skb1 methyltransferase [Cryphonectria parasitica EP155]|uniref:Protein arginine N-methyltransferase n=1 Tax=Cryphonectria parasitica (strain ATCC 38755 / EP155) TaxID=660469 RepID=A0A9P4Y421_CRYP1|nr:Skb1 methyltransferase [Cryphonectria parasitica EP155]KAF3766552.1 Skb1 methyltransferase [Cryphonectria parasitica EP155]